MIFLHFSICPSVILYLLSVCPAIWLIELNKLDKRLLKKQGEQAIDLIDKQNKVITGFEEQNTTIASTFVTSPAAMIMPLISNIQNTLDSMNTSGLKNNSAIPSSDLLGDVGSKVRNNIFVYH